MKQITGILIILALSISAFAATSSVSLMSSGKLNGTQLTAGDYKLNWTGEGNDVQVSITGNGVKMTVPANIAPSPEKLRDAFVKTSDGTIKEIHLGGKNLIVKFNAPNAETKNQ